MKRYFKTFVFLFSTILIVSCSEKTAWVNTERVFTEYKPLVELKENLVLENEQLLKDLELQIQAYGIKERQFRNNEASYSAAKRKTQREALLTEVKALESERNSRSATLQIKSQRQIDSLIQNVKVQIKEYGESNGYDYIYGQNDAGSVLYGASTLDLTDKIIEYLNK